MINLFSVIFQFSKYVLTSSENDRSFQEEEFEVLEIKNKDRKFSGSFGSADFFKSIDQVCGHNRQDRDFSYMILKSKTQH